MNFLKYFEDVNAQKQIDKLAKKYKNKKILIYGAGLYYSDLKNNYDISKLNIVGIADKKFEKIKNKNSEPYQTLSPQELKFFDCDIILVAVQNYIQIYEYLKFNLLINTKNRKIKIKKIIRPTFLYFLKTFIH